MDYLEIYGHSGAPLTVSDVEIDILRRLETPAMLPTTSREFANLKHIGLIYLDDRTGQVALTPLGKAWVRTQKDSGWIR